MVNSKTKSDLLSELVIFTWLMLSAHAAPCQVIDSSCSPSIPPLSPFNSIPTFWKASILPDVFQSKQADPIFCRAERWMNPGKLHIISFRLGNHPYVHQLEYGNASNHHQELFLIRPNAGKD